VLRVSCDTPSCRGRSSLLHRPRWGVVGGDCE
jgi:hypothetical protein